VGVSALCLFVNLTTRVAEVRGAHAAEGARRGLQALGGSGLWAPQGVEEDCKDQVVGLCFGL
jgi:hypothetical protein